MKKLTGSKVIITGEIQVVGGEIRKVCPKCDKLKGASEYGFRKMKSAEPLIRIQAQCKQCRGAKVTTNQVTTNQVTTSDVPIGEMLVGRKVLSVKKDPRRDEATLYLDNGDNVKIEVYGDCCSHSEFTDLNQFDELVGSTIREVDERFKESAATEHEVIEWSFLVFVTNKGHVTIDWRNVSNGCYSGRVVATLTRQECLS